ncbi:UNVERIFIED_CONTAM: hypothetical protein FKN15_036186 [Acipenser sinensis]
MLMLFAERADIKRKPDIQVPYLYIDMGVAVLCASFMSFSVKRRWFALVAALQLAIGTYASYAGRQVHYGDWLKSPRRYWRFSGSGERGGGDVQTETTNQIATVHRTGLPGNIFDLFEDRLAFLNHIPGGEIPLQLLSVLYGVLALSFFSGYYVRSAAQILAILMPLVILFIDGNLGYWHLGHRVEFWNQLKLVGQNVGIFGAVLILATDG